MNKIVLTLTLVALSIPALAAEPVPTKETCSSIAEVARVTMLARQSGVPLRSMMEIAADQTIVDIVTEAYSSPAYSTSEVQEKTIQNFEDKWYLRCLKSYNL